MGDQIDCSSDSESYLGDDFEEQPEKILVCLEWFTEISVLDDGE
jgi:hypothetical protein